MRCLVVWQSENVLTPTSHCGLLPRQEKDNSTIRRRRVKQSHVCRAETLIFNTCIITYSYQHKITASHEHLLAVKEKLTINRIYDSYHSAKRDRKEHWKAWNEIWNFIIWKQMFSTGCSQKYTKTKNTISKKCMNWILEQILLACLTGRCACPQVHVFHSISTCNAPKWWKCKLWEQISQPNNFGFY